MKPATVSCAAVGCQQTITRPLLMCVDHWRMVPAATRRHLWACWRRVGHEAGAHEAHAAAVRQCIDAVHTKQQVRKAGRDAATRDLF